MIVLDANVISELMRSQPDILLHASRHRLARFVTAET
jgi:predicted nucleic acid-binding protein